MPPNTKSAAPRTARGRPYRQIGTSPGAVGAIERVAWLIRVNRLLGDDAEWSRSSTFARAFHGGSSPRGASESTISRWEGAAARLNHGSVRRYEELLGLPRAHLTAVADSLH